ncbi:MAG: hypothetical protein IT331_05900 [Anaerolineae bacterium]|nr:hypothetical protein [Anaerolineae bacterium]
MDSFYATVTTFSFTLLGLWWGVVQLRHHEWMTDPARRRMVQSIYWALLVPAIMSLGAQIAPEIRIVWQSVFVTASVGGIIATIFSMRAATGAPWRGFFTGTGRWLTIALYVLILLTALFPQTFSLVGLTGLQGESIWVTLLVFLGVMLAWEGLTAPGTSDA